ncbi:hypothetical protein A2415_00365 [candidate division WWE3 bacterium RIFOXYC1_FULL_39_7]|uniref:Short-chain dehydrogenase n=1 Tax=candidate division WWE3 bacterium RIFOXYC1_FULL_39_7 TaxID=1802643 RepID=A0A1F4WI25_UNCKA|nr:MAG: hypothetical protein A2415_00365 [candidate division WWE3 bacterium RIFOXYC1_FULL_39_7]
MIINKSKKVIITGVSSGIGKALAREFVEKGAQVLGVARTVKETRAGNYQTLSADLTSASGREKVYEYVRRHWGKCDVLINNAGVVYPTKISKVNFEKVRDIMEINFFAPLEISTRLLPNVAKNGCIVNLLSPAIYKSHVEAGLYSASKAALKSVSDALRNELVSSSKQTKILGYYPGIVRTAIFGEEELTGLKGMLSTSPERTAKLIIKQIENGRNGEYFEPIAMVIRLLAMSRGLIFFWR